MPDISAEWTPEETIDLGLVFDCPMPEPYAVHFDKSEVLTEPIDLGWIGESQEGIWLKVHPQAAFLHFEELWAPVTRFMSGDQEFRGDDPDKLSAFECAVKSVLIEATYRQIKRESRQPTSSEDYADE